MLKSKLLNQDKSTKCCIFWDVMHRDTFVFGGQISLLYPTIDLSTSLVVVNILHTLVVVNVPHTLVNYVSEPI